MFPMNSFLFASSQSNWMNSWSQGSMRQTGSSGSSNQFFAAPRLSMNHVDQMAFWSISQNMFQMFSTMFQHYGASQGQTNTPAPISSSNNGNNSGNAGSSYTPPVPTTPVYNQPAPPPPTSTYNPPAPPPPSYNPPPAPPVDCPPPPPPICEEPEKVLGSAGLFGDPEFGIFTPDLDVPQALRAFDSGLKNNQTVTLLNDSDFGGLRVQVTGTQVNPLEANSIGVGQASFRSGSDQVTIHGNGDLIINGANRGNLNTNGLIAPIQLPSGLTVSTGMAIDGANGQQAERFIITNGEYRITAAPRQPHPDARPYLDMNFEELRAQAADNATGFQSRVNVNGTQHRLGIADLLRIEPGNPFTLTA